MSYELPAIKMIGFSIEEQKQEVYCVCWGCGGEFIDVIDLDIKLDELYEEDILCPGGCVYLVPHNSTEGEDVVELNSTEIGDWKYGGSE